MDRPLSRVYWIGGSPCSGKSTVVDALSAASGLPVYRCDDAYGRHQDAVTVDLQPVLHRVRHASCDDLWMRPVAQQIEDALELYREEFPMILADLAALASGRPVLAEGAALLPELLDPLEIAQRRCLWMVPTEAFQRTHYAARTWRHTILRACTDKALAWENWMARDAGFARAVTADAQRRDRRVLIVDGSQSPAAMLQTVAQWFELDGPTPTDVSQ